MTSGHDGATLAFYKAEASAYATRSDSAGPSKSLARFLAALPEGATVLDLGCGTGRDTKAIIDARFAVTAIDGSAEMGHEAQKRTGQTVRVLLFEDLDYVEAFDGIWANASLLHVPRAALPQVLSRVHRALKLGGILFASFKSGGKEGRDTLGRYYNYLDRLEVKAFLEAAGRWDSIDFREGHGIGFDGVVVGFVDSLARKCG